MATKKRETGNEASSAASYLLRALRGFGARVDLVVYVAAKHTKAGLRAKRQDVTHFVEKIAASCLNQDQTKGKRPAKRKAKRR
jgi:hypothetical protein